MSSRSAALGDGFETRSWSPCLPRLIQNSYNKGHQVCHLVCHAPPANVLLAPLLLLLDPPPLLPAAGLPVSKWSTQRHKEGNREYLEYS